MLGFGKISKGRNWLKFEDSNVGYSTGNAVNDNFTPMGAYFFNIGEDVASINTINFENAPDMGALQLWVVDKGLGTVQKAYWFLEYDGIPAGWFDEDGENEVNVDIAKGQGVLLSTGDAGVTSGLSGEVSATALADFPVNDNFTVFANPYPADLPIANISFKNAPDMGALQMWVVDKGLGTVKKAYWFLEYDGIPAGWFDEDGENEETYDITPGSAVLLSCGDAGVTMDVASPIKL